MAADLIFRDFRAGPNFIRTLTHPCSECFLLIDFVSRSLRTKIKFAQYIPLNASGATIIDELELKGDQPALRKCSLQSRLRATNGQALRRAKELRRRLIAGFTT